MVWVCCTMAGVSGLLCHFALCCVVLFMVLPCCLFCAVVRGYVCRVVGCRCTMLCADCSVLSCGLHCVLYVGCCVLCVV